MIKFLVLLSMLMIWNENVAAYYSISYLKDLYENIVPSSWVPMNATTATGPCKATVFKSGFTPDGRFFNTSFEACPRKCKRCLYVSDCGPGQICRFRPPGHFMCGSECFSSGRIHHPGFM